MVLQRFCDARTIRPTLCCRLFEVFPYRALASPTSIFYENVGFVCLSCDLKIIWNFYLRRSWYAWYGLGRIPNNAVSSDEVTTEFCLTAGICLELVSQCSLRFPHERRLDREYFLLLILVTEFTVNTGAFKDVIQSADSFWTQHTCIRNTLIGDLSTKFLSHCEASMTLFFR